MVTTKSRIKLLTMVDVLTYTLSWANYYNQRMIMLAMAGVYSITMGLVERQITIIMTNILLTINVAFTYTISLAGSNMLTARLRVILLTLMDTFA